MKKNFALLLLLATFLGSSARQVSKREAIAVAEQFMTGEARMEVPIRLSPAKPDVISDNTQPYYIFNADGGKGFVIVSGDDRARKILGYSDTGSIDTDNLPPQLSWLLSEYANQMSFLPASAPTDPSWNETTTRASNTILQTANWGQGAPYNALTPKFNGEKSPTGCVATAMAIALEYLNHPIKGKGEYHYEYRGQFLSFNFEETSFKWNLITKNYDVNSSEQSKKAVAELMFAAGISVEMQYDTFSNGSAAFMRDVAPALKEYFDIDPTCQIIARKHFSDEEWNKIIIEQINNNNPVIYSANQGDWTGGHAWIIDGYNEDGTLFHQNFGWDGAGNGYYALGSIKEEFMPFDQNQSAVINIKHNDKRDRYSRAYVQAPYFHMAGEQADESRGVKINVSDIVTGQPFDISANSFILPSQFAGEYGYAIVSENEEVKEILWSKKDIVGYGRILTPEMDAVDVISHLSNLASNDKIQIVTRYEGDTEWKLVLGSLDAPSWTPIKDAVVNISTITLDIDPLLNIELMRGWYEESNNWKEYSNNDILTLNKNSTLHFRITPDSEIQGKSILFYVNDYFNGEMINRLYIQSIENNEIVGFFRTNEDTYKISASYIIPIKEKKVRINNPGSLSKEISKEEAPQIEYLVIQGTLNAYDFWYINDYFQSLRSLDISDVVITECTTDNNTRYGEYIQPTQNKDMLPDACFWELRRLKTIMLTSSLTGIGTNSLKMCGIEEIIIPAKVNNIGNNFMFSNYYLNTVTSLNPTPPVFSSVAGTFGDTQCFTKGTLYIPKGSRESYETALVWKDFTNIVEVDFSEIDDVEITQGNHDDSPCDIFSTSGICISKNKSLNDVRHKLPTGVYILRFEDGGTRKIVI